MLRSLITECHFPRLPFGPDESTSPSGEVVFRTGREAYYDLKAWKMIYEGCNYVRLVKGETVEVNVVIYPIGEPNGCVE